MRELTPEQIALVESLKTDAYKEIQRKAQEDLRLARIKYEAQQERQRAEWAAREAREAAQIERVHEALRAAGIKIKVSGYYDGTYLKVELPDGFTAELEECDGIDTFDEESK
jgi:hypothetical protein